ncbi:aldo/keto reductase [Paenibacillus farraposensis]|uniref:Aldo/keto reductase n=1 Tax=Paenibacillus farraposensis TaxID=2807095 RepID=A0ABW4DA04_9BACL|nr:aldo/keto reductase [Paenibacillus farraposensis]MCC3382156.1 aldo/keto reductase [Paenibacillus farraposensis]
MTRQQKSVMTWTDGREVPLIGQGTWYMGEKASHRQEEVRALQLGLELGMALIDTAEMYAEGEAEKIVGEAVKGRRDDVYLVSKAYPHHADRQGLAHACEASLTRMGTEYMDMYLLHWRGNIPLEETVQGMEELSEQGKIRSWGVSNLDQADMEELWSLSGGDACAVNQVLYHAASRGIDYDLLPWSRTHGVPVMAYCPIAQGGRLRKGLLEHPVMLDIAASHRATPAQIALAWVIRDGDVWAIPKAVQESHVRENAAAAHIRLTPEQLQKIDEAFPLPTRKQPLDMV